MLAHMMTWASTGSSPSDLDETLSQGVNDVKSACLPCAGHGSQAPADTGIHLPVI